MPGVAVHAIAIEILRLFKTTDTFYCGDAFRFLRPEY